MNTSRTRGFTVIELLVVIGLVAVLATIVMVFLSGAQTRAKDAKINHQVSDMRSQASLWKGSPRDHAPEVVTVPIKGEPGGDLFSDTTPGNNSMIDLINGLPVGTVVYYGAEGVLPSENGKWFVVANLSTGAICTDWTGDSRLYEGPQLLSVRDFARVYMRTPGSYLCQSK